MAIAGVRHTKSIREVAVARKWAKGEKERRLRGHIWLLLMVTIRREGRTVVGNLPLRGGSRDLVGIHAGGVPFRPASSSFSAVTADRG